MITHLVWEQPKDFSFFFQNSLFEPLAAADFLLSNFTKFLGVSLAAFCKSSRTDSTQGIIKHTPTKKKKIPVQCDS